MAVVAVIESGLRTTARQTFLCPSRLLSATALLLPVIERELRSAARQPFTYYLRVLGVAALLLEGLLFGLRQGFSSNLGGALFGSLHSALFLAIWILVPLLTADCLSRERREGTLGLLFLTPLHARGIVVAKGLAHGLRAVTLWVAVLPVLTIPFLLGGIGWSQALLSVFVNFSAICWALAAGLLASAWNRTWARAPGGGRPQPRPVISERGK